MRGLHHYHIDCFVSAPFQRASVPLPPRSQSRSRMIWRCSNLWPMARNQKALRWQKRRRSSMFQMNQIRPRADVWLRTMTPPRTGWTTGRTRVCTPVTSHLVQTGFILAVLVKVLVSCRYPLQAGLTYFCPPLAGRQAGVLRSRQRNHVHVTGKESKAEHVHAWEDYLFALRHCSSKAEAAWQTQSYNFHIHLSDLFFIKMLDIWVDFSEV